MTYLLDTNVVSEWTKPRPDTHVAAWLAAVNEDDVFLSAVTLGELRRGVNRLSAGKRRDALDQWLRIDLRARFEGRILPVDDDVADGWGVIVGRRERSGRPIGSIDALIAATAKVRHLTLATRNAADFEATDVSVFNPWTD